MPDLHHTTRLINLGGTLRPVPGGHCQGVVADDAHARELRRRAHGGVVARGQEHIRPDHVGVQQALTVVHAGQCPDSSTAVQRAGGLQLEAVPLDQISEEPEDLGRLDDLISLRDDGQRGPRVAPVQDVLRGERDRASGRRALHLRTLDGVLEAGLDGPGAQVGAGRERAAEAVPGGLADERDRVAAGGLVDHVCHAVLPCE